MADNPFISSFLQGLQVKLSEGETLVWPNPRYVQDPALFFEEVLGIRVWSKQRELITAIATKKFGAVRAGQKLSKSLTMAGMSLWAYCSYPRVRVKLYSASKKQLTDTIWESEISQLFHNSGRCWKCKQTDPDGPRPCPHSQVIDGNLGKGPHTGLKSDNLARTILGFSGNSQEGLAGSSGATQFVFCDEATGLDDSFLQTLIGNMAGSRTGSMWWFSNPTKHDGLYFDVFEKPDLGFHTITMSSLDSPNVTGEMDIPGLADPGFIQWAKLAFGEDSAFYQVRVLGKPVSHEEGKIIAYDHIVQAEKRWHDTPNPDHTEGLMYIGLDCAGEGGEGDDTVAVARRATKMLKMEVRRGLNEDGHLTLILQMIKDLQDEGLLQPFEKPVVVIDELGVGSAIYRIFRSFREQNPKHPQFFNVVPVRASNNAPEPEPRIHDKVRDAMFSNLSKWLRSGGSIIEDPKLHKELHAPSWSTEVHGRLKATSKDEFRNKKSLGRSPDRMDALALSLWEYGTPRATKDREAPPPPDRNQRPPRPTLYEAERTFDPFGRYSRQ